MARLVLPRPSPTRRRLFRLYEALARRYGPQTWWLARSRFEAIVGAILTQDATGRNAELAIGRLRQARALEPQAIRRLPAGRLAELLRPSGTSRLKARRLGAFLEHLARRHRGDLDRMLRQPARDLRAELSAIPGVGPETADTILLYAAGRPVFVVDAYTRRILARHRLVGPGVSYASLQGLFAANLPRDPALFNEFHALLMRVGKEHCRTRPRCEGCPLRPDLRGRPPRLERR